MLIIITIEHNLFCGVELLRLKYSHYDSFFHKPTTWEKIEEMMAPKQPNTEWAIYWPKQSPREERCQCSVLLKMSGGGWWKERTCDPKFHLYVASKLLGFVCSCTYMINFLKGYLSLGNCIKISFIFYLELKYYLTISIFLQINVRFQHFHYLLVGMLCHWSFFLKKKLRLIWFIKLILLK